MPREGESGGNANGNGVSLWDDVLKLIMVVVAQLCEYILKTTELYTLNVHIGSSLAVQWLGLWSSTVGGTGSIPGRGTKILHATQHSQTKTKPHTYKLYGMLIISQ